MTTAYPVTIPSFQPSLPQDTRQCPGPDVVAIVSGDGDPARLGRMLELAMAAALANESPAVGLDPA
jgi:hypothetical protein